MRTLAAFTVIAALLSASSVTADELLEQGKRVFLETAQPSCTICHTLGDAGSTGEIGPNLDDLAPSQQQVRNAVTSGVGVMPAFEDTLSEDQITAVAYYVAKVTRDKVTRDATD